MRSALWLPTRASHPGLCGQHMTVAIGTVHRQHGVCHEQGNNLNTRRRCCTGMHHARSQVKPYEVVAKTFVDLVKISIVLLLLSL